MLGKIEGKKRAAEDEMVGWYCRFNGQEFEQTPGDSEGEGSLVCCNPWGHKELDMTEWLNNFEEAYHHLCHMPLVTWISHGAMWEKGTTQGKARKGGSSGAILEAGYHSLPSGPQQSPLPSLQTHMQCPPTLYQVWFVRPTQACGKNDKMLLQRTGFKIDWRFHLGKMTITLSQITGNRANSCYIFRTLRGLWVRRWGPRSNSS